ncbi:flavodoxin oxidoreductase [Desulfocucumis palustris]|uniref:Flavodoxin oxidoreductase n=1 Tax=Desulfocucumis palustris TaxID=1898651 RepID=A0A2L2XGD7_9FIRM|nr:FAD-dependent oxidoreductase [Desulfocucumis palustris]GBF34783.1 flavodoxin oxidoreductase [Desulfocucumis palustris]
MVHVVVVGGGWAGAGAALAAVRAGAGVTLLERTDMLLGTGLVGGIMRNNGRYTAAEESICMGAGDIFEVVDRVARHKNVDFPGHRHATLYDVARIEPAIKGLLIGNGVDVRLKCRVKDVKLDGGRIQGVVLDNGDVITGDVFVEATGSAGPMNNCTKYGNGCAMCVLRCPTFGGRVSIAAKAGVKEFMARKSDGSIGAMSGSCKLFKESLSREITEQLDQTGVVVIPIPENLRKGEGILAKKACQQYALADFAENVILLDTGHAKLMAPFYPLELLRQIPGFEYARYEDPYSGGMANSIRYLALSPRNNALQVEGADNLFCGGEKAGPLVGHTEAIITGTLAGHNAVRYAMGLELLEIPTELATGDAIAYVNEQVRAGQGLSMKYTFSGSVYFQRMVDKGFYTTDIALIRSRVNLAGMTDIFKNRLN